MGKNVIVIGAGPAGLTAAYELLKADEGYSVTILEESQSIGGISKTVLYNGNRMDMGGHRFFSKVEEVNHWWETMLPTQGAKSKDDIILERDSVLNPGGPDPEKTDKVMLKRHRISRILFQNKFYDYPISVKAETFKNMGIINTMAVGLSYLKAVFFKLPEDNLENFYINRFGKKLYEMFFMYYTQNLWGRHPREIDASWGEQRVKGLSITAVIKDIFSKIFFRKNRKVETSLIEEFSYPKFGPGQLWESCAEKINELGGKIIMGAKVTGIHKNNREKLTGVSFLQDDSTKTLEGDIYISSMPLKDLVLGMDHVPDKEREIAKGLPYRDYMTLGVLVKNLDIKNKTKIKTIGNIVPDCWIYVQERDVKMGRIQIYNNWSPYMVKDLENTVWLGLEYFVQENDEFWNMKDEDFSSFAIDEMIKLGIVKEKSCVLDCHVERVKKAYPAYFDTYSQIDEVISYLNNIPNLFCVGRNGQHRYNNMDHSMCTSFEAVKNIRTGSTQKSNIWNVNTEKEYHEDASRN